VLFWALASAPSIRERPAGSGPLAVRSLVTGSGMGTAMGGARPPQLTREAIHAAIARTSLRQQSN